MPKGVAKIKNNSVKVAILEVMIPVCLERNQPDRPMLVSKLIKPKV